MDVVQIVGFDSLQKEKNAWQPEAVYRFDCGMLRHLALLVFAALNIPTPIDTFCCSCPVSSLVKVPSDVKILNKMNDSKQCPL